MTSVISYADGGKEKLESESYPTFIIIKGEENIKAYEEAGIIKPSPRRYESLKLPEIGIMRTAVRNQAHYIKYTSTKGTTISGTGVVY